MIMESLCVRCFIIVLVVANGIVLGIQANEGSYHGTDTVGYKALNWTFVAVFTLEVAQRLPHPR